MRMGKEVIVTCPKVLFQPAFDEKYENTQSG
jgi:hypothetical protein